MIKLEVSKKVAGKYSTEDLTPHETIAALFTKGTGNNCKYLTLDHVKHNMLTCVVGKVKPDQTLIEGLLAECEEEIDCKVTQYQEVLNYKKTYDFAGKKVPITTHVFKIISYTGVPRNVETNKHRSLKWMTRSELEKSGRKLSDAYKMYFAWLDDVNTPSIAKPNVTVGFGH